VAIIVKMPPPDPKCENGRKNLNFYTMKNLVLLFCLFLLTNISFAQQPDYSKYESVEKVYWKAGNNNYIRIVDDGKGKSILKADVTDKTQATVFLTLKMRDLQGGGYFTNIQETKTNMFACIKGSEVVPAFLSKMPCGTKCYDKRIEGGFKGCFFCDDADQIIKSRYSGGYSGNGAPKGSMDFTFELIEKVK